ncbi:uncharacterized protein LOC116919600 [Daphnia magna]|uniref:uncharacterized protein LOC116919600 n=1 Tax=Daphnia magna TaxID=35525 RepID=UPI001E1BCF30|nr:uncharacterized protein LOC116919600 [Daphnia magna]
MTKMVVIEGKIDMMTKPIESQAAEQREIDPDFMTEPLKEMEDVKLLEQTLLDNDKYYQLGSPEETLYVAQDCFDFNHEATRGLVLFRVAVKLNVSCQSYHQARLVSLWNPSFNIFKSYGRIKILVWPSEI